MSEKIKKSAGKPSAATVFDRLRALNRRLQAFSAPFTTDDGELIRKVVGQPRQRPR